MQITPTPPTPKESSPTAGFELMPQQEERILAAAAEHLAAAVRGEPAPPAEEFGEAASLRVMGAFVSAKRAGKRQYRLSA